MSLITYEEVRPWARSIKNRIGLGSRSGVMPPWYVEKNIGIQKYKDDPSLSPQEIATIATWVDSGAPRGNPADMPPLVRFSNEEWQIGTPDLIMSTPPIEMKASSPDWWGPLGEVPVPLTEDRFVAAVEYKEVSESKANPGRQTVGGRFIVHHLGVRAVVGDQPADSIDAQGFPTHEVGRNPDVFDPDAAPLLRAGSRLVFGSTHLHSNGRDTKSVVQIGFKLHPKGYKPTRIVRKMGLFGNSPNLDIRPMQADQKFEAYALLPDNAKIVAFEPHMHAAGVRMCLDAIWGAGVSFETLSCVGYDHSWVRIYTFADDVAPLLPRGTILRITGYFDNSPSNKNVSDPRNWSGMGHRSIDNMMNQLGEVQYLTDQEFEQEMTARREKLGLKEGQTVLGCPLCGVARKTPTAATGAN
jgi:hypothetical protein